MILSIYSNITRYLCTEDIVSVSVYNVNNWPDSPLTILPKKKINFWVPDDF